METAVTIRLPLIPTPALPRLLALLVLAGAAAVPSARAGGVQWSVGIQLPAPPVVVYPAPAPVPRVYAPAPVYVQPQPQVIYVQPERPWPRHRHGPRHWRDDDDWRGDGDGDRRGWQPGWRHGD